MPRVLHVIVTGNFAGAERYVCDVARETARHGWEVTVVGGHPERMPSELGPTVTWRPGATALRALASIVRSGRHDVCHAHLTIGEAVAVASRWAHRGRLISTRHFAKRRGSTRAGRLLAPWIGRHLDCEIAISDYVAAHMERSPDAVIHSGVPDSPVLWKPENRTVLVLQRLEPEKDTETAIRAWALSGLAEQGWTLRVVGDGSRRAALEELVRREGVAGVEFAGWQADVQAEFARAGLLLAPTPIEALGLSVLQAMAAGVPVIAAAAGGHVETLGPLAAEVGYRPGASGEAAARLRSLSATPEARETVSHRLRLRQRGTFSVGGSTQAMLGLYLVAEHDPHARDDEPGSEPVPVTADAPAGSGERPS